MMSNFGGGWGGQAKSDKIGQEGYLGSRCVSVVKFHDWALGIGKVFGQESTVVK